MAVILAMAAHGRAERQLPALTVSLDAAWAVNMAAPEFRCGFYRERVSLRLSLALASILGVIIFFKRILHSCLTRDSLYGELIDDRSAPVFGRYFEFNTTLERIKFVCSYWCVLMRTGLHAAIFRPVAPAT